MSTHNIRFRKNKKNHNTSGLIAFIKSYDLGLHCWSILTVYIIRATSSQEVPSNMHKMCLFRLNWACAKYHPGLCSPFIHSAIYNDSVSSQQRP